MPFIATESSPKRWVAAAHTLSTDSVWTNPARTCQRANPSVALPAHAKAALALKLYVVRGGVNQAWHSVANARRAGRV